MAGAVVAAMVLASCGGDDSGDTEAGTGDQPAEESTAGATGGDFCADLEALVEENVEIMTPLVGEDAAGLSAALDATGAAYPDLAESATAAAPDDLAADVATVTGATTALIESLAAVDTADADAVNAAVEGSAAFGPEMGEAADRLSDYARTECGFDPDAADQAVEDAAAGGLPDAADPPDACTFVEAQVAADAAGMTVDVADQDGGGTFNLGVYATDGCSYGNGSLSISTITFGGDAAEVVESYVASAEDNGGSVVQGVALGSLPPSTLMTEVHGYMLITVFEAPTAFSIGFEGLTDPAALVAAAEAVLAATV
jgi:hypothetical protein